MQTVSVEGLEVRVYRGGAGEPLLYLHSGFGEVGRTAFVARVEERFEVLAPELPGFGGSTPAAWHGPEDAVYFLRCLLDTCAWPPSHVAGSSLGAWLAAELAVWFPERVRSLALFDPVGIKVEGEPVADIFMASRNRLVEMVFAEVPEDIEAALGDALAASEGNVLLHFYKAMEGTARIGWNPYLHDPKLRERLGNFSGPATVVWGAADGITTRAYAEAFATALGGARLVVLPGVGHLPVVEAPAEAARVLCEFMEPVSA